MADSPKQFCILATDTRSHVPGTFIICWQWDAVGHRLVLFLSKGHAGLDVNRVGIELILIKGVQDHEFISEELLLEVPVTTDDD